MAGGPHNFLSELTGCFAMPAAENPTVAMIEAAYRHHGLDWRYINCEVAPENLAAAVAGARAMNWAGFNCSLPHKVAVIRHLDGLGESAEIMGAVNCVVRRDAGYIGENTDGKGFLASLGEIVDPAGRPIVMFGAGGAARAVGVELALAGASDHGGQSRPERAARPSSTCSTGAQQRADLVIWAGQLSASPRTPTSSSTPRRSDCFPTSMRGSISMSRPCSRTWSWPTSFPIRHARACS